MNILLRNRRLKMTDIGFWTCIILLMLIAAVVLRMLNIFFIKCCPIRLPGNTNSNAQTVANEDDWSMTNSRDTLLTPFDHAFQSDEPYPVQLFEDEIEADISEFQNSTV